MIVILQGMHAQHEGKLQLGDRCVEFAPDLW